MDTPLFIACQALLIEHGQVVVMLDTATSNFIPFLELPPLKALLGERREHEAVEVCRGPRRAALLRIPFNGMSASEIHVFFLEKLRDLPLRDRRFVLLRFLPRSVPVANGAGMVSQEAPQLSGSAA